MYHILPVIGFFTVPLLIFRVKTLRRGLFTGLFMFLLFWGNHNPLLYSVAFSAALYLYFTGNRKTSEEKEKPYLLNPAFPLLVFFMTAMTFVYALSQVVLPYGAFLMLEEEILSICRGLTFPAWLTGALLGGLYCDKKGPYGAAALLTLLTELSVLLTSSGAESPALFITGSLLLGLCNSAFFTLMPLLAYAFLGKDSFFRFYPLMCLFCFLLLFAVRYGQQKIETAVNPAALLLSLTLLAFTAACFLYAVWKKRLVLVPLLSKKPD